jgi:hypothetical protein
MKTQSHLHGLLTLTDCLNLHNGATHLSRPEHWDLSDGTLRERVHEKARELFLYGILEEYALT